MFNGERFSLLLEFERVEKWNFFLIYFQVFCENYHFAKNGFYFQNSVSFDRTIPHLIKWERQKFSEKASEECRKSNLLKKFIKTIYSKPVNEAEKDKIYKQL